MLRRRLVTRPPWPGRIPTAVALVALVAALAAVAVAAVVGVTAVIVVVVDAVGKTNQWYLDPARTGSDLWLGQRCPPSLLQWPTRLPESAVGLVLAVVVPRPSPVSSARRSTREEGRLWRSACAWWQWAPCAKRDQKAYSD